MQRGEDTAAIERLFRLIGLTDINFVDVQMKIYGMPVTFIYHKKGMKSTGLHSFGGDLQKALVAYEALVSLDEDIRHALLAMLNPGCDLARFYGFEYVSRHLEPGNWLKLLVLACREIDRYRVRRGITWAVSFQGLAATIGWRHEAITEELSRLPVGQLFRDSRLLNKLTRGPVGLMMRCNTREPSVGLFFRDRLGVQRVLERLRRLENIVVLRKTYEREMERLRRSAYRTEDYQEQLRQVFQTRMQELVELAIQRAEEKMVQQQDFAVLEKIFTELLGLIEEHSTQEEQVQLVRDLYEFNRDRVRNQRLKELHGRVQACGSRDRLEELWEETRLELTSNRRHLGPEFENVVTKYFDQQLASLSNP